MAGSQCAHPPRGKGGGAKRWNAPSSGKNAISSGESADNPPQQRGQSGLAELVRGCGDHRGVELFFDHGRAVRRDIVQFQKQQGRADSRPLVLVKKALGLSEVGGLSHGDIELVAVRVKESIEGGCDCGIEQIRFA